MSVPLLAFLPILGYYILNFWKGLFFVKKNKQLKCVVLLLMILTIELSIIRVVDRKTEKTRETFYQVNNAQENVEIIQTKVEKEVIEESEPISESLIKILDKYPSLKRNIKSGNMILPYDKSMVPQGIGLTEEYIIITAYDWEKSENSKCYIYNKNGNIMNTVTLDTKSHVGSIAYHQKSGLLFIPGDAGQVLAYNKEDFLNSSFVKAKYNFDLGEKFSIYQNKFTNIIDYLTIDGEDLYVGNFLCKENGLVQKYKIISEENRIKLDYISEFSVPPKIQGVSFYNKDDYKYMILSKSFGRKNDSHLEIYKYSDTINDYTKEEKISVTLPPMLEQNTVDQNKLYVIFESNASKYKDSKIKVDCICILDIKKIIDELNKI